VYSAGYAGYCNVSGTDGVRCGGCRYEPVSKKLFGVVMLRDLQPGTEAELVKVCVCTHELNAGCVPCCCPSLARSLSALSFRSLTRLFHSALSLDVDSFLRQRQALLFPCVARACAEPMRAAHEAHEAALGVLNPKPKA
jgi:hypothetical protein